MSDPPQTHAHALRAGDDPNPTRRRFLSRLSAGLGALAGAVIAVPPIGMLLHPLFGRKADPGAAAWSGVGAAARFLVGGPPVRVVLKEDRVDAWLSSPGTPVGPVIVQRLAADGFRVLSGICPHLGCSVAPKPASERGFLCPCHRSNFGEDGALVAHADGEANPAPRALDPLEWRVRAGRLEVRWVRYETGTPERIPVAASGSCEGHQGCGVGADGGRTA